MPVSMVSIAPFVGGKANKNNDLPLYLNFISGDSIPNDALVMDGSIAKSLGLKNGYTGVIGWSQGDDRVYNGKSRSNVRFFVMDGKSSFVDKLETAVAKEQAKASVKFQPKFALGGSTKKADASTDTPPVVNPEFMDTFAKEFNRISDIADDTADAEWATLRASVKAEAEKPENKAHAVWFSDFKMKIKEETGVEAD